jgi:hypothetical protein
VRVWTIQIPEAWAILEETGRLEMTDVSMLDPDWINAFDWMRKQMRKFISGPDNTESRWPIWLWVHHGTVGKPPDLRCSGHLPPGTPGVRIALDMPESEFLMSDFDAWHAVLNAEAWKGKHFWDSPVPENISKRWIRDIFYGPDAAHRLRPADIQGFYLQATTWLLKREQVVDISEFTAR